MGKEIIINSEKEQTRIAIVENGELAELHIENPENERTLGDIILGRVRKIMPSIQAAFVDIGQKQDAFLHFSDLSDNLPDLLEFLNEENPEVGHGSVHGEQPRVRGHRRRPHGRRSGGREGSREGGRQDVPAEGEAEPEKQHRKSDPQARGRRRSAQRRAKGRTGGGGRRAAKAEREEGQEAPAQNRGPLESYLKRDQRILVKIVKEPISSKGSRVSTDISLAGRFLVLVPLADYVAVSKKIVSYKERRRLRALAKALLPDGFGVIVRTVAEGKNAKALDTDLRLLIDKWRKIEKKLAGRPNPPLLVHEDVNMASSVIRDLFSDDYDRILIDEPRLYRNIKNYIQAVAPQMVPAVQMYKGKGPIFETTKIARDVAQAFESRVDLPSGGYLFIERTEAMYVVDVNSGRSGRGMTQEDNSLRVNLEAARVIARQTRLRDIGGIIVIDFIDLRDEKSRQKVYDELKKEFRRDRAVTKVLPMSDFGLMQVTRQRLRPSITTTFAGPNGKSAENRSAEGRSDDRGRRGGNGKGGENRGREPRSDGERTETPGKDNASAKEADRPREGRRSDAPNRPPRRSKEEAQEMRINPEALVAKMERWIADYKVWGKRRAVTLRVHPFTAAYLNRRVPNLPTRWFMKHLVRIRLETDDRLHPLSYRFIEPRTGQDVTEQRGEEADTQPEGAPEADKPRDQVAT